MVIVKEGEEPPKQPGSSMYDKLEATLLSKIQNLQGKIEKTEDADELLKLSTALSELLNSLDKIQKMKSSK